jgi:hypothetical protein
MATPSLYHHSDAAKVHCVFRNTILGCDYLAILLQGSLAASRAGLKNLQLEICPEAVKAGHGIHGKTNKKNPWISELSGFLRTINKIDSVASVAL